MPLSKQTILITGAAGGLGGTAALALAQQGASIILLDKNIPRMEAVYDRIVASGGPEPSMYPFDLAGANQNQYLELAAAIEAKFGTLQGLLHSAVDSGISGPIATLDTLHWGQALNVNLNAVYLLTQVLLPLLQKSSHACIVFTSDSAARQGKAFSGAYGVSKIALEGFAKILADELESSTNIRVNVLIPGPIDSPLRRRAYPAENKNKLAPMESLASLYTQLFSFQSSVISGQCIDAQTFQLP